MTKVTLLFIIGSLVACASPGIRIETVPPGADIYVEDKKVGLSPLNITSDLSPEAFRKPVIKVKISKVGYESDNVFLDSAGSQKLEIKLSAYSEDYFREMVMIHFPSQINGMSRELLEIQGLLASKKFEVAQARLSALQKSYPNLAAAFVLQSTLDVEKKDYQAASRNLQRALSLDPKDATVARLIEKIKRERGSP